MNSKEGGIININDLRVIINMLLRNWYWMAICIFLSGVIAYFYTYRMPDVFQAKAQILLESNDKINPGAIAFSNNFYQSYEDVASQQRVIKSANLLETVIDELNLHISYFIVGRIKTTEVYQNMPFKVSIDHEQASVYGIDFHLSIIDSSSFQLRYIYKEEEIEQTHKFGEQVYDHGFLFKIEKSPNLNKERANAAKEINYMFRFRPKYDLINQYKNSIKVSNIEWTSILNVSLVDRIPERAVKFLEVLTKIYVESTMKNRVEVNQNTLLYIDNQITEVVSIINQIESQMEKYKEDKSILDIDREKTEYYRKLTTIEDEYQKIRLRLTSVEDLNKYILSIKDEAFLPPSFYILKENEFLQNSINELYKAQTDRYRILQTGTEEVLPISELDKKIDNIKRELIKYLENDKRYLIERMEILNAEMMKFQVLLKSIPENQRELLNIERKLVVNEKMYSFLLQKRAESIISQAGIITETQVIEKPRSMGVIGPDKQKTMIYFIAAGFLISLVIAIIRSAVFDKIETAGELSDLTDIKVINSIPFSSKAAEDYLVVNSDEKGFVTESFRSLRTNLQFLTSDKETNIIMNTSIHPSEGKTFCSLNLAAILAKAEKKVLLFDFDLHKPKVHRGLKMDLHIGISSYLTEQANPDDLLIKTEIENMDVMLAGPPPPNASELVMSEKIDELLDYFKGKYDYIILDTPPIGVLSDGVILMEKVDICLFVMNVREASRKGLRYLEELSSKTSLENYAILLNGVKPKRWRYYYGGYGGYGYGYGYGGYGYGYSYGSDDS